MTTFATDSSNDLYLDSSGQIAIASDKEAYGEIIAAAIRTLTGELQLDTERGVPYLSTTFNGDISQWMSVVRYTITSYSFVSSIVSFDAETSDKVLSYKIVISTDDGEVTVEG